MKRQQLLDIDNHEKQKPMTIFCPVSKFGTNVKVTKFFLDKKKNFGAEFGIETLKLDFFFLEN